MAKSIERKITSSFRSAKTQKKPMNRRIRLTLSSANSGIGVYPYFYNVQRKEYFNSEGSRHTKCLPRKVVTLFRPL